MKKEQKNRDYSLDWIKVLAIFMVCETHYLHLNESWIDNLCGVTTNMGVPLFFMVNGALLFQKKLDVQKHYAKTFKIFILCVLWKMISVLVVSVVNGISPFENGWSPFINYLLGYNVLDGYELGHFWFLYALIGIYIIFPVIRLAIEQKEGKKVVGILCGILFFFSFCMTSLNLILQIIGFSTNKFINIDFNALNSFNLFGQYGYCLVMFIVGGLLYPVVNNLKLSSEENKGINVILLILFLIGWGLLFGINRFQNLVGYANGIVIDGYFQIPTFIMTTSLFILFVRNLKRMNNTCIVSLAKNSFSIYICFIC